MEKSVGTSKLRGSRGNEESWEQQRHTVDYGRQGANNSDLGQVEVQKQGEVFEVNSA